MKELKSILSTTFTAYVFVVATIILVVFLMAPNKIEKPTVNIEVQGLENLEMHDLTFPVTEYDVSKVAMLEVICCEGCGFVPWTDSWCEFHDVRSSTVIQNMKYSLSRGL
jgi:hypothetical protein